MSPLRPVAVVAAEGVSFDQLTTRLTAFNIMEVVFAAEIPSLMNKMAVACIYEMESQPRAFFERVALLDPARESIWHSIIRVEVGGREPGSVPNAHRTVHGMWNVVIRSLGDYTIQVAHADAAEGPWVTVGERCLTIVQRPHPVFQAASKPPTH